MSTHSATRPAPEVTPPPPQLRSDPLLALFDRLERTERPMLVRALRWSRRSRSA